MLTGAEKFACCQPEPVSDVKVADASTAPVLSYKYPTCVPLSLAESFQKRMPVICPATSDLSLTPSVTGLSHRHLSFGAAVCHSDVFPGAKEADAAKATSTQ